MSVAQLTRAVWCHGREATGSLGLLPALSKQLQLVRAPLHQPAHSTTAQVHSFGTSSHSSSSTAGSTNAAGTQAAGQQAQLQLNPLYLLPMPSLSHAMTSGRVTKWLKAPGDLVNTYDIIAEVTTESLVDEAFKVGDFAGSVTLLLESQEEVYLAAVLVPEGQETQIGTPVAVLCEQQGQVAAAAAAAQKLAGTNVYDDTGLQQRQQQLPGASFQLLEWQSYLKESSQEGGSSCGCM